MPSKDTKTGAMPLIFINSTALRWAETQKQLGDGVTLAVLRFLATKADDFGCSHWSQLSMADELGFHERTLRNHLKKLRAAGLLRTFHLTYDCRRSRSAYQLIAWPGRKLIPETGHPCLGRFVTEDASSLVCWEKYRNRMPQEPESDAALNHSRESILLTCNEEQRSIIDRCLDDLGKWATQKNRAGLLAAHGTLFKLLDEGFDLHLHILPVLREKAESRQRVPRLRSWNYFREAIATHAARSESKKLLDEPPTSTARERGDCGKEDDRARTVRGVVQNLSKRGPLGPSRGE